MFFTVVVVVFFLNLHDTELNYLDIFSDTDSADDYSDSDSSDYDK